MTEVRIAGVVVATSQPAPARWQVRIGRRRWQRSEAGWFELEAAGTRTWVEVSSLVELFGDAAEESGIVDDLAPRAGLVGEIAAPGTPATLARIAVAIGDEIAVSGSLAGPSVVHGAVVACGAGAEARLDEILARRAATPPRDPRPRSRTRPPGKG